MPGSRLALSFGHIPCRLGLCGPEDRRKKKIIDQFLSKKGTSVKNIRKIIKEFKGAYPYYRLISRANKISNPLNLRVVEAYWIGNSLLEKVTISAFAEMMRKDFLPLGKMPEEKIKKLPSFAIPYHNFHVFFIGSVTGRFNETRQGLDLCRVSWGKVTKIEKGKITVLRKPLKFGKKISLGKMELKKINWNKDISPKINIGDWVSIHWGTVIARLNKKSLRNLEMYTNNILKNKKG